MSSPLDLLVVLFLAGLRVDVPPSDKLPKTGGISLSKAKSAVRGYEGIRSWFQTLCQLHQALNESRIAVQRAVKTARENMPSSSAHIDEHSVHIGVESSQLAGCISLSPGEASHQLKASYDEVMNAIRALVLQPIKPIKELAAGRILQRTQATKIPYLNLPVLWSTRLVMKVVKIDMSAKEQLGYQAICGKGKDPQLPNGFQTIAREALVDLHFAIHKVGDFQGDLSSKVAYLVKAMIERIEEFKRVHGDNVEMQPKVVIYVHWEQMVSRIACHLARNGISTSILTGQQSETERETVTSQFQQAKSHMSQALFGPKEKVHVHGDTSSDVQLYPSVKCRTLLVTDVGMTGLNLQQADTLFFLDLPWKKFFLDQSMARACRYGQTRTVTAHLLVAKNTLDTYTTTMYAHRSDSSMPVANQVVAS